MTGLEVTNGCDVSRETLERLEIFQQLLIKWNKSINLVSRNSISDLWTRHIVDSIQVFRISPIAGHWVDLGSGAGFPGLVAAILAADERPEMKTCLLESDRRKVTFLQTVVRETGVDCKVLCERIELAPQQHADIVSARALAPLSTLLEYSGRHLGDGGTSLFPKGVSWKNELETARLRWCFDVDVIDSQTMPGAVILKIKGAGRV